METSFYQQTKNDSLVLDHVVNNYQFMISNSNLCWAACMESLIKGYETQSQIGHQQLEIANYYNAEFLNSSIRPEQIEKVAMYDQHYLNMYQKAGFKIHTPMIHLLENLSQIKKLLKKDNTLLIRRLENERSHIMMIVGIINDRYMVLDPDSNSKGVYYWSPKKMVMKYGIEKLWAVTVTQN
jgi:hypothetical protein